MVRERLNVYYYGAKESKKFVVPVFGDVGILNVVMFLFPNFWISGFSGFGLGTQSHALGSYFRLC